MFSRDVGTNPLVEAVKTCWKTKPRTQPQKPFTPREGSHRVEFVQEDSEVQERERGSGG